jgi:FtsH-binding integral membrane protein
MSESYGFRGAGAMSREQSQTLFAQTMWYVAVTAGIFALGAYLGRHLTHGLAFVFFIVGFGCLIAMRFAVRRSPALTRGLLFAVGAALGLAMSPTLVYYASVDPRALWQAGGATALFIAGFGAVGYTTRRDLSWLARLSFGALIVLILAGIVLIFVHIPGASLAWSVFGLLVFAGLTVVDFQRLRRATDYDSAPLLAASIFIDALNVFLFFLRIFGGGRD